MEFGLQGTINPGEVTMECMGELVEGEAGLLQLGVFRHTLLHVTSGCEGDPTCHREHPMGGTSRPWVQPDSGEQMRGGPSLLGGHRGVHKQGCERLSMVCLDVTRLQDGKRGNLGQRPALPQCCHLAAWVDCSQPICRDVEPSGKREILRIYKPRL